MEKNKTEIILIALAIIAFAFRFYLMPSHLFFGPEQGRDFLVIRDIVVNHKLTLIGSKTDIMGIFHGPIFYYLAAIPFAVTGGNPLGVSAFFIIIQGLTVFLVYQLTYELTKRRRAGLIAAILFAVSFLFIVYARWLSNPPLSIPFSLFFMLFLLRYVRGKSWYLVASAFAYGLLGQAEFINFLLFAAIGLLTCLMFWKKCIRTKLVIVVTAFLVGLVTSFATYILFDARHDGLVSRGVLDLIQGKSGYQLYLSTSTAGAFRVLLEQAAAIMGLSGWVAGLVVTVPLMPVLFKRMKRDASLSILALWIWVPPFIFAILRHGMLEQLYAGVIGGFIILLALAIDFLWEKKTVIGVASLVIIVVLSVTAVFRNLPGNYQVFFQAPQPAVRYSDQLAVIDWIYMQADGRQFSFQAYTIPYFLQDAWVYLLGYYGQKNYGYLPDDQGRKRMYVVIQEDTLDPKFQKKWYRETTSVWGTKTNQARIGNYTVEEWAL
ncbi:MAG: seg [Microgenomates group bacterium GW2011_GWC1_49_7]|nr:MAG: seg [Microgenomates group bacterium GW2011_GWC1_49_7]